MDKIDELLTRRVDQILPAKSDLEQLLRSGKKIRLYQGFDPTGVKLHLGHSIGMRNLQSFAELGHEVIVLFGTGTVLVGDPSERNTGRKLISQEEINENIKNWKDQVSKLIDFDLVTIKYNGDWLIPLTLKDIIYLASHISAVQLFKRDSFTNRLKKGDTVWFHETFYPLLQGYDSVVMDVDLEIGGTDQTFNMLVGRELQKKIHNRDKYVLTNPMILGTDGHQMSKTSGNCIWLDDSAEDMYGKTMSIPDQQIPIYARLLTDIPIEEIQAFSEDTPLENKKRIAREITKQFHGEKLASMAEKQFQTTVQDKQLPTDIPEISLRGIKILVKFLEEANLGSSNSQRKRLVTQGGVEIDGKKYTQPQAELEFKPGMVIKYGKRTYVKIGE